VESATVRAGYALTITTLTMLGGFGAGLFSELPALRVFSLLSCIALLTALAASLALLPALLICFAPRTVPGSVSALFRARTHPGE